MMAQHHIRSMRATPKNRENLTYANDCPNPSHLSPNDRSNNIEERSRLLYTPELDQLRMANGGPGGSLEHAYGQELLSDEMTSQEFGAITSPSPRFAGQNRSSQDAQYLRHS